MNITVILFTLLRFMLWKDVAKRAVAELSAAIGDSFSKIAVFKLIFKANVLHIKREREQNFFPDRAEYWPLACFV